MSKFAPSPGQFSSIFNIPLPEHLGSLAVAFLGYLSNRKTEL